MNPCGRAIFIKGEKKQWFEADMILYEETDLDSESEWPSLIVTLKEKSWFNQILMDFFRDIRAAQ
jgi:hypothetical protein